MLPILFLWRFLCFSGFLNFVFIILVSFYSSLIYFVSDHSMELNLIFHNFHSLLLIQVSFNSFLFIQVCFQWIILAWFSLFSSKLYPTFTHLLSEITTNLIIFKGILLLWLFHHFCSTIFLPFFVQQICKMVKTG